MSVLLSKIFCVRDFYYLDFRFFNFQDRWSALLPCFQHVLGTMNGYRDARSRFRSASPPSKLSTKGTMSTWLEQQASNHHVQLAATAVLSGAAVAGLIYGSQYARRKVAIDELKASIPELTEEHQAQKVCL